MHKKSVISHFGSPAAVAKFLGIARSAVSQWPDPIPMGRAYQLEKLTKGALRVDPALYEKGREA